MKRSPMRRGKSKSAYANRERATAYMLAVKQLTCCAIYLSPCEGEIEADHAGRRGLGQKCADEEVIPLCTGHHRARTDFSGCFRQWQKSDMRVFLLDAIERTQATMRSRGLLPDLTT